MKVTFFLLSCSLCIPLYGMNIKKLTKHLFFNHTKHFFSASQRATTLYNLSDEDFVYALKHYKRDDIWKNVYDNKNPFIAKFLKFHGHFDYAMMRKNIGSVLEYEQGNQALLLWCCRDITFAYTIMGLAGIKKLYYGLTDVVDQQTLKKCYNQAYEKRELSCSFDYEYDF